jgi:DNA-binding beta-propeller fold protein YncE
MAFVTAATFVSITVSSVAGQTSAQPSVNLNIDQSSPVPTTERPIFSGTQWWVMSGDRAVVLDEKGARRANVELGVNPLPPVRSADGRYLAVASLGKYRSTAPGFLPGLYSGPVGIRADPPGGTSTISLLDANTLNVVARRSVRFGPAYYGFTEDGQRLVVISWGEFSNKKQERTLPALTVLDVPSGEIKFQSELVQEVPENCHPDFVKPGFTSELAWLSSAGLLHFFHPTDFVNGSKPRLVSIDVVTGAVTRTPLPSNGVCWYESEHEDLRYLELRDSVVVVNARGEITGVPFGPGHGHEIFFSPLPDGRRYLLASDTGPHQAQLLLIENGGVSKQLALSEIEPPKYSRLQVVFDNATSRLMVIGKKQAVVVDVDAFAEISRVTLPERRSNDVRLDPGGEHVYVYDSDGGGVSVANVAGGHLTHYDMRTSFRRTADRSTGNGAFLLGLFTAGNPAPRYVPVDGRHLLALAGPRVQIFDTEGGGLLVDKEFPDSVVQWEPSLGLIFVRNASGTTAYRPVPLEAVKNFGPDTGLSKQAGGLIFHPRGRRFLLTTAKGSRLYDYELNQVAEIDGTSAEGLFLVEPPMGR